MKPVYGLPEKNIDKIAATLEVILADTVTLYIKSWNYHWNMEDPRFLFLHQMIEEQYTELAGFIDLIAERIRQMGRLAPATMKEFISLQSGTEGNSKLSGDEMLADLASTHEAAMAALRKAIDESTELGDFGTADMLTEALRAHEKAAWILRSHLMK